MRIALLGLGKMGIPIGRLLLKNSHELTVWNRTATATESFALEGAAVAASAADAVKGMPVVFTSLSDDAATSAVAFGNDTQPGILKSMGPGAIHVSLSTISVGLSQWLADAHHQQGQYFVGAPVFGRPHVAEQGKLWIAVAGDPSALELVRPLLEIMSRGLTVVSDQPWRAHALKLGGNFMIAAMIQTISEAMIFAEAHGIAPELFLETVNSALFQSAFYTLYGGIMLHPPQLPGTTIKNGNKDVGLFREAAAAAERRLPLADYIAQLLHRALESGMKEEEWATSQYRITQSTAASGLAETGNAGFNVG